MLNAARLKDRSASIEHARLLWKDGHHRKAIQTLEGAISANEVTPNISSSVEIEAMSFLSGRGQNQNESTALVSCIQFTWTRILTRLGSSDASQMDRQGWPDPLSGHCSEISRGYQAVSEVS